ncbi:MAG: hypothetical protein NC213_07340 [Acetobacter sp.]|nr:hypothetical protein [Bacteroides sp.]MCM1341543.1 hypothetical protein [Acetobacter sp.]MCM1433620.1 hypothetical protein [Clostridiales bacterium]
MKKLISFILALFICLSVGITVFGAEKAEKETTQDASYPRLMVTSYKIDGGSVRPSKKSTIKITFKNFSKTKAVSNIKLSLIDESGELHSAGTGTEYVDKIYAGSTYTWTTTLTASQTAQIGEHKLNVSAEYEDKYFTSYSSVDTLLVNVKQSVSLDYNGIILPKKMIQGDTSTIEINLMNTGKTDIRNAKVIFDVDGLESGGTLFIGEIPVGESKAGSANLRVSSDKLGEISGAVSLSYDDAFGKNYKKTIDVNSVIEKKPVVKNAEEEKDDEKKNPQWWIFVIVGVLAGGGIGFAIPTAIYSKKQRLEDEKRL